MVMDESKVSKTLWLTFVIELIRRTLCRGFNIANVYRSSFSHKSKPQGDLLEKGFQHFDAWRITYHFKDFREAKEAHNRSFSYMLLNF